MEKRNIQHEILAKLLTAQSLRYSEARPEEVEGDLYAYHLKFLVQKGLIAKIDNKYVLTNAGKAYLSSQELIQPQGTKAHLFKLGLHMIVYRQRDNKVEILMQKRKRHPRYGMTSFVSGPLNKGEFAINAAQRILQEETNLSAIFHLAGFVRKVFYDTDNNIIGDTLYHICIGQNVIGELAQETIHGENKWIDIDQAIKIEQSKASAIKKELEILQAIKMETPLSSLHVFYEEETQVSDDF